VAAGVSGDVARGVRAVGVIGVVGAGTMGAGIAQLAVEAGHEVLLHDIDAAAIERGRSRIRGGLERRAARLDLDPDSAEAWVAGRLDRLRAAPTLADLAGAKPELVVEAVLEDLEPKRALFRTLDEQLSSAILATNTSALSVAAIAAATGRPGRVLGLHFFNPAPVMPLVEVVIAPATDPAVADRASAIVAAWGKVPVRCTDTAGFIVNRVNRPFTLEALAILAEGGSTIEAIDRAIRAAGFPMGPFELMDLVGIDVNLAAARGIRAAAVELGDPLADRFRPSPIQEALVGAGRLGRKTDGGFYAYDESGRVAGPLPGSAGPGDPDGHLADAQIVLRITLAIVNEAYRALGERIATAEDIDLALRLGAAHPSGPFERAAVLGGPSAVRSALLEFADRGPRFDPAPLLSPPPE
jgi:3-hydroxybutyryl-CoA dehydrogenase